MSEQAEPNRQFEPVPVDQALKLFREGAKSLASTMIWTKNQEISFTSHLCLVSDDSPVFHIWAPSDLDLIRFEKARRLSGEDLCRFSMSLDTANVFFKADFLGKDDSGLKFKMPDSVYKVQRRKNMRVAIPNGYIMKVTYRDPLDPKNICTRKVLDISAGGLAIMVNEGEEAFYPPGILLEDLTFLIRGISIVCKAEIRHRQGQKVGLLFQGLNDSQTEQISLHVMEETRKIFSRFM